MNTSEENRFKEVRRLYNEEQEYKKDEITLQNLADILVMDKSNFSKLEAGKKAPTLEDVKLYHEKFGVSMEYLIGESVAMKYEDVRVGTDLGVTDAVADTMVLLKDMSTDDANYSAVLNAFIGNGEATQAFITTMLSYLFADYISGGENSSIHDALMTTTMIKYINQYVKPQLTSILETKRANMEENYNSNDYNKKISIDELKHLQEMVASCYTDNPN